MHQHKFEVKKDEQEQSLIPAILIKVSMILNITDP